MSKKKPHKSKSRHLATSSVGGPDSRTPSGGEDGSAGKTARRHIPSQAAVRETIESVVVAFVLAFLFRTFEAEAFVIPTGSMAPTLMGRHKDLVCPECGYSFRVSASDEVDQNGNARGRSAWVEEGICPMCRYPMDLGPGNPHRKYPSFKGDRILVGKINYEFSEPKRWDVAVFKYPGEAKTNFIKRLVGLPEEVVRISHGDIFTSPIPGADEPTQWIIARKPPHKLLSMLQPVFDNEVIPKIIDWGWPARWRFTHGDAAGAWQTSKDNRSFETTGSATGEIWLRYEHRVPSYQQWKDVLRGGRPPIDQVPPQLISDFCTYNTGRAHSAAAPDPDSAGLHWVGDLALSCKIEVRSQSGEVVFELVEGGCRFQCRIDVATGTATLDAVAPDGLPARTLQGADYVLSAPSGVRGSGEYEILFANVDDQLRFWVDGRLVPFGASDAATCYAPLDNKQPTQGDLAPLGIGASGGACLRVSQLRILRDIYYIAEGHGQYPTPGPISDFRQLHFPHRVLSDPSLWGAFRDTKHAEFVLGPDRFLALGDNSAKSKDSRLWEQEGFEYFVRRDLLIGKALYIYWPHSWDKVEVLGAEIPFPFFPNFPRMGFVR